MSKQQILIQKSPWQLQVAVLEDGRLAEYNVQRMQDSPAKGSIYRGVVESVLPGMQAAFVDIGWTRNAYLALEDLELDEELAGCHPNIGDVLKEGQSLVVQIMKEAVDAKGPKVTTRLSVPGRALVLIPGKPYAAVSRKILPASKRQALKDLADELVEGQEYGIIIRTAGKNGTLDDFREEFAQLDARWHALQQKIQQSQKPGLIQADEDLAVQVIRDCAREADLEGIYVNDFALYEELQQQPLSRKVRFKIRWREENLPEQFGIQADINTIHKRKVWLKNGGYLVFDRTEALNVVDVNTGKFTGKQNNRNTFLQMNLEAAEEIAWQIRLRNLSGMILMDFIDMQQESDQQLVLQRLEECLRRDPVKTSVLGMTQLGLVEMTRKKMRAPLTETLEQPCPFCRERGRISSAETVGLQILEELQHTISGLPVLAVQCHPLVAGWLLGDSGNRIQSLEQTLQKEILLRGDNSCAMDSYQITARQGDACGTFLPVHKGEVLQVEITEPHQGNPEDGIARINGFIIQVEQGAGCIAAGLPVAVEVTHVMRTHAVARLLSPEQEETP